MNSFGIWHLLIIVIIGAAIFASYRFASLYKNLIQVIGVKYISINPNLSYLIFIPFVGFVFYGVLAFSLKRALTRMFDDGELPIKTDAVIISLLAFSACGLLILVLPFMAGFMCLATVICFGFNWWHAANTKALVMLRLESVHRPVPSGNP